MKIKEVEIGSTILMNGIKAIVKRHGNMGTFVKVVSVTKNQEDFISLGGQIWSRLTDVEIVKK